MRKGEQKTPQRSAWCVAGRGVDGDAHAGAWHRQVSLLAAEDIERMRQRGLADVKPGDFERSMTAGAERSAALRNGAFILDLPGSERRAAAALLSSVPALRSLLTRGRTAA